METENWDSEERESERERELSCDSCAQGHVMIVVYLEAVF